MKGQENQFRYSAVLLILLSTYFLVNCTGSPNTPITKPNEADLPTTEATNSPVKTQIETAVSEDELPDQDIALLPAAQADLAYLEDIPHYQIDLFLDYDRQSFDGRLNLDYTNMESISLDRLYFRLLPNGNKSYGNGSLIVDQVKVGEQLIETGLSLEDTILEVPLLINLDSGEQVEVEIDFHGKVPVDFGGEETPSGYGIYNFSDGVLALSGWYPILAVYDDEGWNLDPTSPIGDSVFSDIAYYSVTLEVDSDLVPATTGVEVGHQSEEGQTKYQFVSGPVRDFFLILSPDFEIQSEIVAGTKVNSFYLPEHEEGGEVALSLTSNSLRTFNERFGPYPYTELDVVEAPMRNALGVEYPAIFLISSQLYDDPQDVTFIVATVHEVAHQWWYNLVGNDVFDDPWLDEALTTYSSSLYFEEISQQAYQGLIDYWQSRYEQLERNGEDDLITQNLNHFENLNNHSVYGTVVYSKGALFFAALREEVGDKAFFDALQKYYLQHKYQIADPEDLLNAFEETVGRSLEDFYQGWLYAIE